MNKRNKARLLKLADFLDGLRTKKFYLGTFLSLRESFGLSPIRDKDIVDILKNPECGTVACAVGYCPVVFPRSWVFRRKMPALKGKRCNSAFSHAKKFFGIDDFAASQLFSHSGYANENAASPSQVAEKIRKFVKAN